MRGQKLHVLRRPKVRQSWNKYNLYNLSRLRLPNLVPRTFFQQKFYAKQVTRGYHGEHIREKQWERMFSRRLNSVVNMRPDYMAKYDGSEQAAGRGSGLDKPPIMKKVVRKEVKEDGKKDDKKDRKKDEEKKDKEEEKGLNHDNHNMTPYMNMAFWTQERRLDTAIFRAMFASSVRAARQMCIHGAVKVNGQKMPHPTYMLNPGDMFQVNVDHVLVATGKKKSKNHILPDWAAHPPAPDSYTPEPPKVVAETKDEGAVTDTASSAEGQPAQVEPAEEEDPESRRTRDIATLNSLRASAKSILTKAENKDMSAKQKQGFRQLQHDIKKAMSTLGKRNSSIPVQQSGSLINDLAKMMEQLQLQMKQKNRGFEDTEKASDPEGETVEDEMGLSLEERKRYDQLMRETAENPIDRTKPYATPWEPRDYMAPFAFIPRYLEVNQKICAAVYLRHPVARQGLAEVPTPFPPELNQLAFNFYLRRR